LDQPCLALLRITTAVLELGARAQGGDLAARAQVEALDALLSPGGDVEHSLIAHGGERLVNAVVVEALIT
jgi:hypothetical protein